MGRNIESVFKGWVTFNGINVIVLPAGLDFLIGSYFGHIREIMTPKLKKNAIFQFFMNDLSMFGDIFGGVKGGQYKKPF